jgi:hypothetical protein
MEIGARMFCVRSKNKGEVCLDDNETSISGARRANVIGLGARDPLCRGIGIAKIQRKRQSQRQQGRYPVDGGIVPAGPRQLRTRRTSACNVTTAPALE